jgi:hypothetical protein
MQHIKIRICRPKMTNINIQCSLACLGRATALQAQGQCRFDGVVDLETSWGWQHCGPGTAWVNGVTGLGTARGAQRRALGEDDVVVGLRTASQAWGRRLCGRWCYRLGSGKMAAHKGPLPWSGTTVWMLRGGLNDGTVAPERTRWWHRHATKLFFICNILWIGCTVEVWEILELIYYFL